MNIAPNASLSSVTHSPRAAWVGAVLAAAALLCLSLV